MTANGYPLALAVLTAALGVFVWLHARREDGSGALPAATVRLVSLCAALTAVFAIAGIPPWRDALAGVFGTGPGMVVLVLLATAGIASFAIDVLKHHHPVRSSVLGIVGATSGAMAWAMAPELGRRGARLGPKTATAMGQAMHQISSGHAARAETGSARAMIIFLALVALVVLWTVMHRHHKRRPFAHAHSFGAVAGSSARAALPPGRGGAGQGGGKRRKGVLSRVFGPKEVSRASTDGYPR
jgi:hypothetical protein